MVEDGSLRRSVTAELERIGRERGEAQAALVRLTGEAQKALPMARDAGLTLTFIAAKLGVTRATLHEWEARRAEV